MNVRQSMKAAAIAIPMMFSKGNASAQTANVAQTAVKAVVTDTVRSAKDTLAVMDSAAIDAKAFLHRVDSVAHAKADSVANLKADSIYGKKPRFTVDASYITARYLPQDGVRLHAQARKNKDVFDATGVFAGKHMRATMFFDGAYTRRIPVSKNDSTLNLTASAGGTATIVRTHEPLSDQYGIYSPRLAFGVNYKKYFGENKGGVLRLKAEAGPAVNIKSVAQTHTDNNKVKGAWYLNAEAEAGSGYSLNKHPQVSVFLGGGHHPVVHANLYAGFKYRF